MTPAPLLDLTPADDPTVRHIRDCLPRVGIRERLDLASEPEDVQAYVLATTEHLELVK